MKFKIIAFFLLIYFSVDAQLIKTDTTLYGRKNSAIKMLKYYYKDSIVCKEFFTNGHLHKQYLMNKKGQQNGLSKTWDIDGNISLIENYKKDKREGTCLSYNKDGSISSILKKHRGKGVEIFYDSTMVVDSKVYLKNNKDYKVEFFCKNGKIHLTRYNGNNPYKYNDVYCNGNPFIQGTLYYNQYWIGPFKKWYENGNLMEEGKYLDVSKIGYLGEESIKIGKWFYYDENGKLLREELYDNEGKLIK